MFEVILKYAHQLNSQVPCSSLLQANMV